MIGAIGGGCGAGQRAGQRQRDDVRCQPPVPTLTVQAPQPRAQRLVAGDQRQHRRKTHLERHAGHFLRFQQHQHDAGQSKPSQRDDPPVRHRAQRKQARHRKAAHDRHVHAGQHHVESAHGQSDQGRQRLGRPEQAGTLRTGEAQAGDRHRESHDDADMQPRHRQQMRQAGVAERLVFGLRDAGLAAGQQSDADRPRRARHHRDNPSGDGFAEALYPARGAGRCGFGQPFHRSQGVAGAAEPGVERVALQVPPAGVAGWGRGADEGANLSRVSGCDGASVGLAQPHPDGAAQWWVCLVKPNGIEGHTPSVREIFDRADGAGDHGCVRREIGLERRCAGGGELRRCEADCCHEQWDGQGAAAGDEPGHCQGQNRHGAAGPEGRFEPRRVVSQHAHAHENRQPQRHAFRLGVPPCGERFHAARRVRRNRRAARGAASSAMVDGSGTGSWKTNCPWAWLSSNVSPGSKPQGSPPCRT